MFRHIMLSVVVTTALSGIAAAHPGHGHHHHHGDAKKSEASKTPVKFVTFNKKIDVDGQGSWKFRYRPDLSQVPVEEKFLLEAHGGFAVDRRAPFGNQQTYFGLPGVGLLRISHDLQDIKVIGGDDGLFKSGETNPGRMWNYHNAAAIYNGDELHIGLPSNNAHKIWVVTPEGKIVNTFGAPPGASGRGPTDLLQVPKSQVMKVTYGYGDNRIYEADPFADEGAWNPGSFGGRGPRSVLGVFKTPHGITLWPDGKSMAVADREYGRVQRLSLDGKPLGNWDLKEIDTEDADQKWPRPCDVDFSPDGDVALVGNLEDQSRTTSDFHIIDVKTGRTLSTITPSKLGVPNSRHIHNAIFRYVDDRGVFVICLFWRPGGYAVFERVSDPL